jgi:hypothetical protein
MVLTSLSLLLVGDLLLVGIRVLHSSPEGLAASGRDCFSVHSMWLPPSTKEVTGVR